MGRLLASRARDDNNGPMGVALHLRDDDNGPMGERPGLKDRECAHRPRARMRRRAIATSNGPVRGIRRR